MKRYKVGIIGHFGFGYDLSNGQTIKTKIVADAISDITDGNVCYVDTHGGLKTMLSVLIRCVSLLRQCDNIFVLPAQNGVKVLIPLLAIVNRIYNKTLHYDVIGGWLPAMLQNNKWLIPYMGRLHHIYVETNTMQMALEQLGIMNSVVIPNCKKLSVLSENALKNNDSTPLPLCTFSRVMKEKGIEDIVNVVKDINSKHNKIVYTLDIYGQVDQSQIDWFTSLSADFPSYINYRGVVPYDKSVDVLKNYFALVFPTRFYTEGIPGTIIDAYAAGLPVVSAIWESFSDIIDDGITGYGYGLNNTEQLQTILENAAQNPDVINRLKKNCLVKAQDYTIEKLKSKFSKIF